MHFENLLLLAGFLAISQKRGRGKPFPLAYITYFVCNPGMDFAVVLAGGQSSLESSFEREMFEVCFS